MSSPATPPTSQRLFAVLAAAFLGWMFDGLEMGIFPIVARPALQQMQATAGAAVTDAFVGDWMGIITATFLIGAALGGVVFGWLGDRIGRVRAMNLSILVYSVFTALIWFAQTPWHLAIARFVGALGMGGQWSLGVALVMEVWPEKHRPMLAGVIGAAANVGFALIAGGHTPTRSAHQAGTLPSRNPPGAGSPSWVPRPRSSRSSSACSSPSQSAGSPLTRHPAAKTAPLPRYSRRRI